MRRVRKVKIHHV